MSGFAQNGVLNQQNDSIAQAAYDFGTINLPDPEIIKESYTYDPLTDQYYYSKAVGGFNLSLPLILSRKEYEKILMRAEMRRYFSQKFNAVNGTLDDTAAQRDMLPRYYVNSKLFSGIFGSNEIDVKPTGSVEFDMGIRHTKQENPLMSSRNRKSTTFDFDQRISMGLQGMVGTRLAVNANYDTQASFDFQNIMKLEYSPDEDDIVQKVEVGNVSMPISGSLIRGAQSLFGVKTELKFGKTTITGVFSEQKSQTTSVNAEGGGMMQDFEMFALDYDEDRHFFLSQYFRSKYDEALKKYPYINSRVRITRVEVWVTNRFNRVSQTNNNLRNIVAIQDLGEGFLRNVKTEKLFSPRVDPAAFVVNKTIDAPVDNKNNQYDPGKILHEHYPEMIVDGEIQMDFALNNEMLKSKFPFSKLVNKKVNTLVFPNLDSANITYKMLKELNKATSIGPIIMGLEKAVHIFQLGASVDEMVNMTAVAVVDAQVRESRKKK